MMECRWPSPNLAQRPSIATIAASLGMFVASVGCGPSLPRTMPISGVVTLDGEPVEGASVLLIPVAGGHPATGVTDAEGKFVLSTFDAGDGAIVGQHGIAVTKSHFVGEATSDGLSTPAGATAPARELLPARYAAPSTSGLTFDVSRSSPPLVIELHQP